MKIEKSLNNNVVIAIDDKNIEYVVLGNGVGFGVTTGDQVDSCKVMKKYVLVNDDFKNNLITTYETIPKEIVSLCEEIYVILKDEHKIKIKIDFIITLSDHLNFAIERHNKGVSLRNNFLWELARTYPTEFQISVDLLSLINERLKIDLPEDEAGFLTYHIVNFDKDKEFTDVQTSSKIVNDILDIVKYVNLYEFDTTSLSYYRFLTHLKYFSNCVINNDMQESQDFDSTILDILKEKNPDIFNVVLRIEEYLVKNFDTTISNDERTYLMIHLTRILSN